MEIFFAILYYTYLYLYFHFRFIIHSTWTVQFSYKLAPFLTLIQSIRYSFACNAVLKFSTVCGTQKWCSIIGLYRCKLVEDIEVMYQGLTI